MAGISLLSLFTLSFLYEGKFVHRIFAAITFQLFATLAEVFTFLFIKLFPVETSENASWKSSCLLNCIEIIFIPFHYDYKYRFFEKEKNFFLSIHIINMHYATCFYHNHDDNTGSI